MKKFFALLIFLAAIFTNISYWEDIGNVALRFCNNSGTLEKTLSLTTSWQEAQDICMTLINGWNNDVNVSISFVDWTITNDTDQKKACKNEGEIENFWQYMQLENRIIEVPAKGSTTFIGKLVLPEEKAWEIHGCVTYFIANQNNKKDMFSIMVRRANFIDIFAKGIVTIWLEFMDIEDTKESLSKNPKIVSSFDKNEKILYIQSILRNKWTAEQWVTIKWEIKNRLWYKKTFFEEKRTIFAKQNSTINGTIDDLPFYKWPFTITYTVEHSANIQEGLETDNWAKEGKLTESTSILIITKETYISLIVILALIAGIIIIIKRKKIKHSVSFKNEKKKINHKTKKISHK